MNEDTTLSDLLRNADQAIQSLVKKAFEDGIKQGKEDAAREFQAVFNRLLSAPAAIGEPEISPAGPVYFEASIPMPQRAQPGTVRPAIVAALKQSERGLRPADIAAKTRLSENTVRGTLRSMKIEGVTEKRGELWLLVQKNEAADADPGRGSSTASISNPAHGREAGPGGGT